MIKKEDKINKLLMKLKKNNEISDDEYSQRHVSGTKPGILYGLPRYISVMSLFAQFYLPSEQLVITLPKFWLVIFGIGLYFLGLSYTV